MARYTIILARRDGSKKERFGSVSSQDKCRPYLRDLTTEDVYVEIVDTKTDKTKFTTR